MSDTPAVDDDYLDAAAKAAGLTISPEHRPGVLAFLRIAAGMAETLKQADLDERTLALAPTYRPLASGDGADHG